MFATLRRYELGAGTVSDLMPIVDAELADRLADEPGFVGYSVIASGEDTVVSLTLFRDERSSEPAGRIVAEFVRDRLQPFQLNLVSAMGGEVGVSRTARASHSSA